MSILLLVRVVLVELLLPFWDRRVIEKWKILPWLEDSKWFTNLL